MSDVKSYDLKYLFQENIVAPQVVSSNTEVFAPTKETLFFYCRAEFLDGSGRLLYSV